MEHALPPGVPDRSGGQRAVWDVLLDDLTIDEVREPLRHLAGGPGGELQATAAGNRPFCSAESSALMAVNLLAPFVRRGGLFGLPHGTITFEHQLRVRSVRSPVGPTPDLTVTTPSGSAAIEAKTAEPWRSPPKVNLSTQYDPPAQAISDGALRTIRGLRAGTLSYRCLDAAQLLKHLIGIHSAVVDGVLTEPVSLILLYWRPSNPGPHASMFVQLSEEIDDLGARLQDQPVAVQGVATNELLDQWAAPAAPSWLQERVPRLRIRYDPPLSSTTLGALAG